MLEQMADASCLLCSQNCRRIHGKGNRSGASFPGFAVVVNRSCLDEDCLSVPSGFTDDLREMLEEAWEMQGGHLYLEGPSRSRWPVATCEDSLSFVEGWHAFATDHCLEAGDVLFFKVIDSLVLAVSIFDSQGSAKMKLFPGSNTSSCNEACGLDHSQQEQPCQRRFRRLCKATERSESGKAASSVKSKGEPCSDVLWSSADQAAALGQPPCLREKRALEPRKLHFGTPDLDSSQWEEYLVPVQREVPDYKQVKQEVVDLDQWEEVPYRKLVKQEVVDLDELGEVRGCKQVKHEVIDLDELGEAAAPATPVKQEAAAFGRGSKRVVENVNKETKIKQNLDKGTPEDAAVHGKRMRLSDNQKASERKHKQASEQPSLILETRNLVDRNVHDLGTSRGFDLHSTRRDVTAEEMFRAFQRAHAKVQDCKHLGHPAFLITMLKSHVLRGFWLGLPEKVCKRHLGGANRWGWLVDGQGRRVKVKYIGERSGGGLSAGWGGFARQRSLDLHDVCVFELVDKNKFVLQVHIFRVVDFDDSDLICKHLRSPRRM